MKDYWEEGCGWKWARLIGLIPDEILHLLAGFVLSDDDNMDDEVGWGLGTSGSFSLRTAYEVSTPPSQQSGLSIWKTIWGLRVPHRISFFVWLVMHEKILTNVERGRRHLTTNTDCFSCACFQESCSHLFRHCKEVQGIWEAEIGAQTTQRLRHLDWAEWLQAQLKGDRSMGITADWPE